MSWPAFYIKLTAELMKKFPRLNRQLYTLPWGVREARFDEISCAVVVTRKNEAGEDVLFPRRASGNVDQMSIDEIHDNIRAQ
ncbi:MAG: hypothetical protein R3A47_05485 [Polyangiales bacterium]